MPSMMPFASKALLLAVIALVGLQAADATAARGTLQLHGAQSLHVHRNVTEERMGKVIAALSDILTNAEEEEKVEAGNYKCFIEWCQTTESQLTQVLEQASGELEEKQASVTQLTAKIAHLQQELDDATKEIEDTSNMMEQAKNIRQEENERFTEDLTTNRQSVSQVKRAIEIIGGVHDQGGFLQNGMLKKLQLNAPGESDYVLGVMKGLKINLEKTGEELQAAEMTKLQQYDSLMATKGAQLKSLQDEKATKTSTLQNKRMQLVSDEHDVARLKKFEEDLHEQLATTKATCEKKKGEWQIRGHDRSQEKAALRQAITYLKQSVKEESTSFAEESQENDEDDSDVSFLQVQSGSNAVDAQVSALLAGIGSQSHGNFDEAKKVVLELLAVLQSQEKEEAEKKKYCEHNLAEKEKEEKDTQDEIEALNATILQQEAETATLIQEIDDLKEAISIDNATLIDATKIRKQDKDAYTSATKDRALSLKVMAQAKKVLSEFYATEDPTGLLQSSAKKQTPSNTPPPTWTPGSTRSSLESMNVLEIIDKIAQDIRTEQKDADMEEQDSATAYEKLVQETREAFDERMEEITTRAKRKAKLGVQHNNDKETSVQTKEELTNIHAEQVSLHNECDDLLQHFDQRVKARRFEMDQLHDVFDILSGSEIASRTGLMQKLKKKAATSWAAQQVASLVGIGASGGKS